MAERMERVGSGLRGHVFEAAVAAAWTVVGAVFLGDGRVAAVSPVGREVHPFDTFWSVLYVVGGPLVLWSLVGHGRERWRVAGLTLLATGLTMQGIAALTYQHRDARVVNYFIFAIACALRALLCGREVQRRSGR